MSYPLLATRSIKQWFRRKAMKSMGKGNDNKDNGVDFHVDYNVVVFYV